MKLFAFVYVKLLIFYSDFCAIYVVWLPKKFGNRGEDQQDQVVPNNQQCTFSLVYKWQDNQVLEGKDRRSLLLVYGYDFMAHLLFS